MAATSDDKDEPPHLSQQKQKPHFVSDENQSRQRKRKGMKLQEDEGNEDNADMEEAVRVHRLNGVSKAGFRRGSG